MPGRQFKADSRNSTLLTPAFQRAGHLPTVTRPTPSTSNTCMCAHSQPRWHMGTPGIHSTLRRNSTPPPCVHFPRKSSTNKRFPWLGREVSPEIDVSHHCQLCAMATSFFQASGETWSSKLPFPRDGITSNQVPRESPLPWSSGENILCLPKAAVKGDSKVFCLLRAAYNLFANYGKRGSCR